MIDTRRATSPSSAYLYCVRVVVIFYFFPFFFSWCVSRFFLSSYLFWWLSDLPVRLFAGGPRHHSQDRPTKRFFALTWMPDLTLWLVEPHTYSRLIFFVLCLFVLFVFVLYFFFLLDPLQSSILYCKLTFVGGVVVWRPRSGTLAVVARMVNPVVPRLAASGRRDGALFCVFGLTIGAVQKKNEEKKKKTAIQPVAGGTWRLLWRARHGV